MSWMSSLDIRLARCFSTVFTVTTNSEAMELLGVPFCKKLQHLAFPGGQSFEGGRLLQGVG